MFLFKWPAPMASQATKSLRLSKQLVASLFLSLLFASPFPLNVVKSSSIPDASVGTIAYVRGDTRDEIRLIEPDGTEDRLLWKHDLDDPNEIHAIYSLTWHPDGSELAFASTHEHECSLYYSDIYAIGPDKSDYRRITQAPACAELADFPQGIVEVPVENCCAEPMEMSIYFQGATTIQHVSLPPYGSDVVTFDSVADLGDGIEQRAVLINKGEDWDWREIQDDTAVDVQAGATVETATILLSSPFLNAWDNYSPTWNPSGTELGYIQTPYTPRRISANPVPLTEGDTLVTAGRLPGMLDYAEHLRWAPTTARANQLLYVGEEIITRKIFLMTAGSDSVGEPLVTLDFSEDVLDLAWLPDGSGFVFSLKEPTQESEFITKANIYAYSFATSQVTPLTDFGDVEYAGRLSVAPDGQQIVFERANQWSFLIDGLVDPDLWIMDINGDGQQLLVENGRAPAWNSDVVFTSPEATTTPTSTPVPGTGTPTNTPVPGTGTPTNTPMPPAPPPLNRLHLPAMKR